MDIAEITFDTKTKRIIKLDFLRKDIKFRCKRCAVFCCKLGGPTINDKDIRRLRKAGIVIENVVEPTKDNDLVRLKETENGACTLLKRDDKSMIYACSVYNFRPSLCRLYPFEFVSTGENTGILRTIPLCNGLNATDGELVDRKFVEKNILGPIMDSIKDI